MKLRQGRFSRSIIAAAVLIAAGLLFAACGPNGPRTATRRDPPPLPKDIVVPAANTTCDQPAVKLRANGDTLTTITRGQLTTLTWEARNADSVEISPGIGKVQAIGNREVQPQSSVTYTIAVSSKCGAAGDVARITVNDPPLRIVNVVDDKPKEETRVTVVRPEEPKAPPTTNNNGTQRGGGPSGTGGTGVTGASNGSSGPRESTTKVATFGDTLVNILFDYDKSDLREDQITKLQKDVEYLKQHTDVRFAIEGHSDERGNPEYNLALSDRRANNVKQYLASQGVAESRISTRAYGKERPECMEASPDESCHQKNRRTAFRQQ